jgi:hypothetical protein
MKNLDLQLDQIVRETMISTARSQQFEEVKRKLIEYMKEQGS